MKQVEINIHDATDIFNTLTRAESADINHNMQKRKEQLKKSPAIRKMLKFRYYLNEDREFEFWRFNTYKNFKEAVAVFIILHQKDHMTRIMNNRGKYEVWSRLMWW
jgi:hypothetical protein